MSRAAIWIVAALIASGAVLVAFELGKGALEEPSPKIANPCNPRGGRTGGIDATIQRIVLDGLDGAACRLHISREQLVLSVGASSPFHTHWTKKQIEVALRAGLLSAVDDAERRGDLPPLLAGPIRKLIETAPIDKLVSGGLSLRDLLSP